MDEQDGYGANLAWSVRLAITATTRVAVRGGERRTDSELTVFGTVRQVHTDGSSLSAGVRSVHASSLQHAEQALTTAFDEAATVATTGHGALTQIDGRPIVLGGAGLAVLLHATVGHFSEADVAPVSPIVSLETGTSVTSPLVSCWDTTNPDEGAAIVRSFDDRGTDRAEQVQLIDNGRITGKTLTGRTQSDRRATGNARRATYADDVLPRLWNVCVPESATELADLALAGETVAWADRVTSGQVNPATGEVTIGLKDGRLIRHGEVVDHFRSISLTGDWLELLGRVQEVAGKAVTGMEQCRKARQDVLVGVSSPACLLSPKVTA